MQAMARGLPRNWVPQVDPVTNAVYFLNTRTGSLHRNHPNVREVLEYAARIRPGMEAKLAAKQQHLEVYANRLRIGCEGRQRAIIDDLKEARRRAVGYS